MIPERKKLDERLPGDAAGGAARDFLHTEGE